MASKVNGTTTTFSKYQAAEFEGLEALDARWKHISDNIIPQTPYILTLPSAIPYPRDPRLAHEWMKDGPFEAHEEQLQYLSFIRNWDDGLIVPVGGWDDDKGGIAKESPPEQRRSETNTPKQGQTAGKKISLADYKLKRAAGQLGSKTAEKPTKEADQATTMSREASKSSLPTSSSEEHALPEGSLKRSADMMLEKALPNSPPPPSPAQKQEKIPQVDQSKAVPSETPSKSSPAKRAKVVFPKPLSQLVPLAVRKELLRVMEGTSAPFKLLQSETSSSDEAPLSRKLPVNGESTKIGHLLGASGSRSPTRRGSSLEPRSRLANAKPPNSIKSKDSGRAGIADSAKPGMTNLVNSVKTPRISSGTGTKPRKLNDATDTKPSSSTPSETARATAKSTIPSKIGVSMEKPRQKIVRLKIPKGRRKDVARLLQMPARPKKTEAQDQRQDLIKGHRKENLHVLNEPRSRASHRAEEPSKKRVNPDDEPSGPERSVKKIRSESREVSKRAVTPSVSPFKSPALSRLGSGQKPPDHEKVPRRLDLADSEIRTPQATGRSLTPLPNGSEKRTHQRSSSNTDSLSGHPEDEAMRAHKTHYDKLSYKLSRKAKQFMNDSARRQDPALDKVTMATLVETYLSYMLTYITSGGGRGHCSPHTWATLYKFISATRSATSTDTHIHGLCQQLEAVCRDFFVRLTLERLDHGPPPDSDTTNASDSKRQLRDIAENVRLARSLWTDGTAALAVDDLRRTFPDAWARRRRTPLGHARERLNANALDGAFYLPMSGVTTPIEAVRASWCLLREWARVEQVPWEPALTF